MNHRHCHLTFCLLVLVVGCASKTTGTQWVAKVAANQKAIEQVKSTITAYLLRHKSKGKRREVMQNMRLRDRVEVLVDLRAPASP
jgi:hypothetical protein